jgi:hypothetical protein
MLSKHLVRDLQLSRKVEDFRTAKPNRKIRPEVPIYLSVELLPASLSDGARMVTRSHGGRICLPLAYYPLPHLPTHPSVRCCQIGAHQLQSAFLMWSCLCSSSGISQSHAGLAGGAANHNISSQLITIAAGG